MIKIALILAVLGHILCGVSDCLLGYSPKGRLDLKSVKDPEKMSAAFESMPLAFPLASILLGVLAITMFGFGYLQLSSWVGAYSGTAGMIMLVSSMIFLIPIAAHHVLFAVVEWVYIRLDRTPAAREAVLELQKKTIAPMLAGYAGLLAFVVTLFIMIVSGGTPLPAWSCIFNTFIIMILLLPTKLPAKGNIAGAVMFLGLLFVM